MNKLLSLAFVLLYPAAQCFPGIAHAQSDPGVRSGPVNGQPGATQGGPLPLASVNANSPTGILEFFDNGLGRFQEVEVVSGGANVVQNVLAALAREAIVAEGLRVEQSNLEDAFVELTRS